jgi:Holliday junction DNA helicase RuvB
MMENATNPEILTRSDETLDNSLRPKNLTAYFGQELIKKNIRIFIDAAQKRQESLDHVLFYGPPGLGKTTLAKIIGFELKVDVKITSGPAVERAGDLASILTNLKDGDILFIDEIHRLNKVVEETLYPAMEDHRLDIILGRGPSARTLRLDLPKFTLVGATTRIGLMSGPIRDRFGSIFRLNYYDHNALQKIIHQSAEILQIQIDADAAEELSRRSRGTPRIANRLLKRVRDFADVKGNGQITREIVVHACDMLKIDQDGLDSLDLSYLQHLIENFSGGPVGLDTLAASLSEDTGTLEDVVEPYLIQQGYIKKTPRGRLATKKALDKQSIGK